MNEHEREIRLRVTGIMNSPNAVDVRHSEAITKALDALLAEHRAALARARAGALDDASEALGGAADMAKALGRGERSEAFRDGATLVLSLKDGTTPAPASIPVERAREVLLQLRKDCVHGHGVWAANEAGRRLGVPLDGATEKAAPCAECEGSGHGSRGKCLDCDGTGRETS